MLAFASRDQKRPEVYQYANFRGTKPTFRESSSSRMGHSTNDSRGKKPYTANSKVNVVESPFTVGMREIWPVRVRMIHEVQCIPQLCPPAMKNITHIEESQTSKFMGFSGADAFPVRLACSVNSLMRVAARCEKWRSRWLVIFSQSVFEEHVHNDVCSDKREDDPKLRSRACTRYRTTAI